MREAQLFELRVRELIVVADVEPDPPVSGQADFDIELEVAELFRRPLGRLAQRLNVDVDLEDQLQTAVRTRNSLAHEFLVVAFLDINIGRSTHRETIRTLDYALGKYQALGRRLEAVVAQRRTVNGIEPENVIVEASELRRMLGPDSR